MNKKIRQRLQLIIDGMVHLNETERFDSIVCNIESLSRLIDFSTYRLLKYFVYSETYTYCRIFILMFQKYA